MSASGENKRPVRTQSDYTIKLIAIGDAGVGKTSVTMRYFENTFNDNQLSTIGVAQKFKVVSLLQKQVKLQVYDTAG